VLFRTSPGPVRGAVTLGDRPGLGLEPDEDILADSRAA
jgi:L-alanine-DL-glutamate epimerase-like enolase superfamily enzyme